MGIKLHLGCGDVRLPGFINVDVRQLKGVDAVRDARDLHGFGDGCADVVYACHLLEHFWPGEVPHVLRNWHRVLRRGGCVRIAVPDFYAIAQRYLQDCRRINPAGLEDLRGLLYGSRVYPEYPEDTHHSCWDQLSLGRALDKAGFRGMIQYDWRKTEHAHIDDCASAYLPRGDIKHGQLMSLNMEATKA